MLKQNKKPLKKKLLKNNTFFKKKKKNIYFKILTQKKTIRVFGMRKHVLPDLRSLYNYGFNRVIQNSLQLQGSIYKKINIKFVQNNIFCSLIDLETNKTLHVSSAGTYKITISSRKLKHFYIKFLKRFFRKIIRYVGNLNHTFFNIIAPSRLRKKISKLIVKNIRKFEKLRARKPLDLKKILEKVSSSGDTKISTETKPKKTIKIIKKKALPTNVILFIDPKKCFNGCRAKKRLRKKRRISRFLKRN